MKRLIALFLLAVFLISDFSAARERDYDINQEVNRFFDSFMDLVSYNRKRDFYDRYVDRNELSYHEFSKIFEESAVKIEGSYKSELISYQKKGREVELILKLSIKQEKVPAVDYKRLKIMLKRKDGSLIIPRKELQKIFVKKRSSKR